MKKTLKDTIFAILGGVILLVPLLAVGQTSPPPVVEAPVQDVYDIFFIVCNILSWIFVFFIVIAVIFIIWAGFKYLTAGGESEEIKEANHKLIYAVVAIVIAILARSIPFIIANFVGAQGLAGASC